MHAQQRTDEIAEFVGKLGHGDRRALARLLTVVESGTPEELRQVVAGLYPITGRARVVGVTGSPGVGKSTLTNALAAELRDRGRTVAVLAVDPSSPYSGGALLGDRVRMRSHQVDHGVFIRSMASRGRLGGLSAALPQAVLVVEAAGFDDVLIETVGAGQSDVEIAATADTTIVALAPGAGDDVQVAKAGVLEVADVFVVTKADQPGAGQLAAELRRMVNRGSALEIATSSATRWRVPVLPTVAVRSEGVDDLADAIGAHGEHLVDSGEGARRHRTRALDSVRGIALEQVRLRFSRLDDGQDPLLEALADKVVLGELDPYTAADELYGALEARPGER